MAIKFDDSQIKKGVKELNKRMGKAKWKGILDVANEILRLSQFEVPHDEGRLQNSGQVEPHPTKDAVVGYNTEYAARLHENPQYNFQKGRKGKYLEDPIKHNISIFRRYIAEAVREVTG